MRCWSQNIAHSCPISGLLNSWVLRTNLFSQRSHSPHRHCLEWYLAHSHRMPRPTPTDHRPILSRIHPTQLRQPRATFSLTYRGSLNPDHIMYGFLSGFSDARQEILRSRRPFVPAERNLLNNLAGFRIDAFEWTTYRLNAEYCENTSRFRVFIPTTSTRPVGLSLHWTAWVKLNRLRTGVGRIHSSILHEFKYF